MIEEIKKMQVSKGFIITDHNYGNIIALADKIHYLAHGFLKELTDKKELVDLGYLSQAAYNRVYGAKTD